MQTVEEVFWNNFINILEWADERTEIRADGRKDSSKTICPFKTVRVQQVGTSLLDTTRHIHRWKNKRCANKDENKRSYSNKRNTHRQKTIIWSFLCGILCLSRWYLSSYLHFWVKDIQRYFQNIRVIPLIWPCKYLADNSKKKLFTNGLKKVITVLT